MSGPRCLWNQTALPLTLKGVTDTQLIHKYLPGDTYISFLQLKTTENPFEEWKIKCNQFLSSLTVFFLCFELFWILTITGHFVLPSSASKLSENTQNSSLVISVSFITTQNRGNSDKTIRQAKSNSAQSVESMLLGVLLREATMIPCTVFAFHWKINKHRRWRR